MGLDIALVGRLALELALDDDIGLGEAFCHVAMAELMALGDVGRLLRRRFDALGEQVGMKHGRARLHRLLDVGDVRQDLIVDLDQLQGLAGGGRVDRRHGRHRMPIVKGLVARHDVARHVAQVAFDFLEVVAGDDGLHAGKGERLLDVDLADAGMGVGAAQYLAHQHAGRRHVGAEFGAADDLVDAVRPVRPAAHEAEALALRIVQRHYRPSLISAAALMTARTILS